jgi:putative PIN family toxin of toxin-antitoxin system
LKLVLDTNVLISGMINPSGAPGRIVDRIRLGGLTLCVDDRILAEYARVLRRPRFARYFNTAQARDILAFLYAESDLVVAAVTVTGLPDPDDAPFLEVALTAQTPLVSGNLADFPAGLRHDAAVLLPAEFVQQFLLEGEA